MKGEKINKLSEDLMNLPFDKKVEIILELQKISIEFRESMKEYNKTIGGKYVFRYWCSTYGGYWGL